MRRAVLLAAGILTATFAPVSAEAQIQDDGLIITTSVLGTIAGITNSIAVTVYAVDGRSLGSGWIVSSLFSSAICGSIAVSFVVSSIADGSNVGASVATLFYTFLTAWPTYYVVRSAISDAEPGEYFDVDVAPDETTDPIDALDRGPTWARPLSAVSFDF